MGEPQRDDAEPETGRKLKATADNSGRHLEVINEGLVVDRWYEPRLFAAPSQSSATRRERIVAEGRHPVTGAPLAGTGHTCGDCELLKLKMPHRAELAQPGHEVLPGLKAVGRLICTWHDCNRTTRAGEPACKYWEARA